MNFKLFLASIISASLFFSSCELINDSSEEEVIFETAEDTLSYIIGTSQAQDIIQKGLEINSEAFILGIKDALDSTDWFSEKEKEDFMRAYSQKLHQKEYEEYQAKLAEAKITAAPNREKGAKFLAENKAKDGVNETKSGLQYKVLKQGKGNKPKATDTVKVHYKGSFIDGTVFESSYERNEPVEFPLNRVMPGWTEGIQLMPAGSKYMLFIPSELAYGDMDARIIKGGSTLIFEVELLEIIK